MTASRSTLPRAYVGATVAILVLSVASSLLGLFQPGFYTDPPAFLPRIRIEDLVILAVGVPVLAVGLRYASRDSARGRVVWLGALTYMSYMWLSRALLRAFNEFFIGYVALFALSLFTLIGGLLRSDPERFRHRLEGQISRKAYSGVLAVTSAGLAFIWLPDVLFANLHGTTPLGIREFGPTGLITHVIDLGLLVPSFAIAAYLLWHGRTWSYIVSGVLLVWGALMAPTLTALTVVDYLEGVTMTPGLIVGTVLPPVIVGVFALRYLLVLGSQGTEHKANVREVNT